MSLREFRYALWVAGYNRSDRNILVAHLWMRYMKGDL